MSGLTDLVATALVGVNRRPPAGTLRVGAHAIDGRAATAVLDAAALYATARRAGRRPGGTTTPSSGTTTEPSQHHPRQRSNASEPQAGDGGRPDLAEAPAAASQLLELVLSQAPQQPSTAALLAHWITAAAAANRRVPHRLLLALLSNGRSAAGPQLTTVLGPRGRWLAALNPEWSWAVAATAGPAGDLEAGDALRAWQTADQATRQQLVRATRRHDPVEGRELIRSTWKRDRATEREAYLRALAPTLEPGDEPFLTEALTDRSAKVRSVAVDLLAELPASAWVRQRVEQLQTLIRTEGPDLKRLTVALPDGNDDFGDPPTGTSRRTYHLRWLVSLAPLALWTEVTGWAPSTIVARGVDPPDVILGWIRATIRQRDPEWAEALLTYHREPELVSVLPEEQAEPLVLRELEGAARAALMLPFAVGDPTRPWSPRLSAAVVARLNREQQPATFLREYTAELGSRLDASAIAPLQQWHDELPDVQRYLAEPLRAIIQHVSTRIAISAALTPDPGSRGS